MFARNGFDGPWDPLCPYCRGYMHTGHTPDCPVTLEQRKCNEKLAQLFADHRAAQQRCAHPQRPA